MILAVTQYIAKEDLDYFICKSLTCMIFRKNSGSEITTLESMN